MRSSPARRSGVIVATTGLILLGVLLLTLRLSNFWPNDQSDDIFPACEYGYTPSGEVCAP